MSDIRIIHLTEENKRIFDAFLTPHIDDTQCIQLPDPPNDADVDAFISQHRSLFLPAGTGYKIGNTLRHFYSVAGSEVTSLPDPVNRPTITSPINESLAYQAYIDAAQRLIISDIENNNLIFSMDPKHELAIFYRADNTPHWSIITTRTIPKIDYVRDLLKHTGFAELPQMLAINSFVNDRGQKTEILTRYYLGDKIDNSGSIVLAAPMYILHSNGQIERVLSSPEDEFVDRFKAENDFLDEQKAKYGNQHHKDALLLPAGYSEQELNALSDICARFIKQDEKHFVIYKTKKTKANDNIKGSYQQKSSTGELLIQQDDATSLDFTLRQMKRISAKPTRLSVDTTSKPSKHKWTQLQQKHTLHCITDISTVAEGVRIAFTNTDYLIDEGNKLTLHGTVQDDYLKAMILHAKDNWGGVFKIDQASDSERAALIRLAGEHGVRIIGLPAQQPIRPTHNPVQPRPAQPRQAAQATA